jgi:hypothetical protein
VYYNKINLKSKNKCKTTLAIIKELSNKYHSKVDIQELMIDSKHSRDQQVIAYTFNNSFSSIIDKISKNNVDKRIIMKIFLLFIFI